MRVKQNVIDEMRKLAEEGKSITEISKILHSSTRTVRKYVSDVLITPKNAIIGNEELIIRLYLLKIYAHLNFIKNHFIYIRKL